MLDFSNIPLYSIFILILILSGGYTIELIPCRLKKLLTENIFIKHFFCLLTLIFFVSLTESQYSGKKLSQIIFRSILLYIIFMFLIKTDYRFFIIILILLAFIYLIKLKNDEIIQDIENEKKNIIKNNSLSEDEEKIILTNINFNIEKYIKLQNNLYKIKNILIIITLILILFGFIIYLGQKKYEYKDKFSYIVFLFGKSKCKNTIDKNSSILKSLQYLFTT